MNIQEEIAIKIRQKLCGSTVPGAYTPHQRDIADFILSKDTLELLRPLYALKDVEVFDILRKQDWFCKNRKTTHEDIMNTSMELRDGDVVGVL